MMSMYESPDCDAEHESRQKMHAAGQMYNEIVKANLKLSNMYFAEEKCMIQRLKDVRRELQNIEHFRANKREQEKHNTFFYYYAGKPYFKDRKLIHPPDNEDTILMKQYHMYDFSNLMSVSGWTMGDRAHLLKALQKMAQEIIQKRLLQEISTLKREKNPNQATKTKIAKLDRELASLKFKTLDELQLNDNEDFDWEEIALILRRRHSAKEYKSIWNLFLHWKVNKEVWLADEHHQLQCLAEEKKMQDWDSMARELGTGRTGYQCFVYYRTNMEHPATGRKWTEEEMSYLQRVINLYKEDNYIPWAKVAASVENRTKVQCYNKYMRMIEGRKGRFLPEEDAVILNFVNVYGTDYRRMMGYLPGRSSVQLRVRHGLLLKRRVSATWTLQDDRKLLLVMANLDSPASFSIATKHFLGKDRHNIRSRYNTLMRWMRAHPDSDISHAPRRAARRLAHGAPAHNLRKAMKELRDKMAAERRSAAAYRRPRSGRLARDSPHSTLHDALMTTVASQQIKKQLGDYPLAETHRWGRRVLAVQDIASRGAERAERARLKALLVMLHARLASKEAFYQSCVGKNLYLLEIQDEEKKGLAPPCTTYSKSAAGAAEAERTIDLFGRTASRRKYMLPPNFATITGSRVILTQLNQHFAHTSFEMNLKSVMRRRPAVRAAVTELQERFNDLFTWPYLLSNEPPEYYSKMAQDLQSRRGHPKKRASVLLSAATGVTIRPVCKAMGVGPRQEHIDLGDEASDDSTTIDDNLHQVHSTKLMSDDDDL